MRIVLDHTVQNRYEHHDAAHAIRDAAQRVLAQEHLQPLLTLVEESGIWIRRPSKIPFKLLLEVFFEIPNDKQERGLFIYVCRWNSKEVKASDSELRFWLNNAGLQSQSPIVRAAIEA